MTEPRRCLLSVFLTCLAALTLTGCQVAMPSRALAPANVAAGEVQFELAGPGGAAMLVPVKINGQGPFYFVLDTGATVAVVDQRLAQRLNLPERRGVTGIGTGIGSSGPMKLVSLQTLQVGNASGSDLTAGVVDIQHLRNLGGGGGSGGKEIEGLVGLNFLRSFRVTIDFQRSVLQLQKPQTRR